MYLVSPKLRNCPAFPLGLAWEVGGSLWPAMSRTFPFYLLPTWLPLQVSSVALCATCIFLFHILQSSLEVALSSLWKKRPKSQSGAFSVRATSSVAPAQFSIAAGKGHWQLQTSDCCVPIKLNIYTWKFTCQNFCVS